MSDNKAQTTDRKLALIAPFAIGLAAIGVVVVLLLRPDGPGPAPVPDRPQAQPAPASAPAIAAPADPISRAELIEAAQAAASAYAADAPSSAASLLGRKFALRLAFGCAGPAVDPGPQQAYYQLDPVAKSVRLVARPAVWTDLPLVRAGGPETAAEVVEGFWIPRPWSRGEGCPHRRAVDPPAAPTPVEAPSLGVAMFHDADGSRAQRRGDRPYEYVLKLPELGDAQSMSFTLLLEGRITGFADRTPVRCWSESADHRPVCLYAVELDRVAFEDARGGVLAQWPT